MAPLPSESSRTVKELQSDDYKRSSSKRSSLNAVAIGRFTCTPAWAFAHTSINSDDVKPEVLWRRMGLQHASMHGAVSRTAIYVYFLSLYLFGIAVRTRICSFLVYRTKNCGEVCSGFVAECGALTVRLFFLRFCAISIRSTLVCVFILETL